MGQFAVQLFKSRGAYVIISGLPADREKLDLAKALGADVCATNFEELQSAVYSANPKGADITCDCTDVTHSLENCMKVIRPMGTHLQIGLFGGKVPFRLDYFFDKEVNVVPSNSTAFSSWEITLELLAQNKVTLKPFVSGKVPLENRREGPDAVLAKSGYKFLLIPDNNF